MQSGTLAMAGPLQKNLSRRVSFNEATLAKSRYNLPSEPVYMDTEAPPNGNPRCRSYCNSCCAWISLVVAVFLLIAMLIGGMYFAFLQSNLPDVRLQKLDVFKIDVNNTNNDTFLTTDIQVTLNTTNQNDKIELSYSKMTCSLSSEGIDLGNITVSPFNQNPGTSENIKFDTSLFKTPIEESAAKDLLDKSKLRLMVIDVFVKGHIRFLVNGHKLNGFPFKISCQNIDQSEIDNGHAPKCSLAL